MISYYNLYAIFKINTQFNTIKSIIIIFYIVLKEYAEWVMGEVLGKKKSCGGIVKKMGRVGRNSQNKNTIIAKIAVQ